jgi:cell shape-determining protein MreC
MFLKKEIIILIIFFSFNLFSENLISDYSFEKLKKAAESRVNALESEVNMLREEVKSLRELLGYTEEK